MVSYWWTANKEERAHEVIKTAAKIYNNQVERELANKRNLLLYGNLDLLGLSITSSSGHRDPILDGSKLSYNVIQSMVDTIQSKMVKNQPKPTFLTAGGDWSEQRKAKKLTKFCEGQFYQTQIYKKAPRILLDALIFGTGFLKIYEEDYKIKTERVFPNNITVDDKEGRFAKPRSMYQTHYIHRDVLVGLYPKHKAAIEEAETNHDDFLMVSTEDTDMIKVIEAWHLPSSKRSKDGLHSMCIEQTTLFEEEWAKDYFPFVELRWNERPIGFYGQGLSEQLTYLQIEINKILRTIQVSMHLGCVPKIFVEKGSKIVKSHLDNSIGGIIEFSGVAPRYEQLMSVPPQLFTHLDTLVNKAYEIAGVSMLSAQSKKPAGLDSGVALREYNDIESERFLAFGKRYEDFFMDSARIFIDMARDIAGKMKKDKKAKNDYEVKVLGKRSFSTIKWSDISLNEEQYVMQMYPTSSLPQNPAAKLQKVVELMDGGIIPPEFGLSLLDFPDLEAYSNRANADINDIERTIEHFVEFEPEEDSDISLYQPPEDYQNLKLGIKMMQSAYLQWKNNGLPEERLELFRNWIDQAIRKDLQLESEKMALMNPQPEQAPAAVIPEEELVSETVIPPEVI